MKRTLHITGLLAAFAVSAGLTTNTAQAAAFPRQVPNTAGKAAAALPVVNMEVTVLAAEIDPRRADHTLTPGAKDSVMAVEQALQAKHLLAARWVNGYFGTTAVSAYAAYQRSLGYTGLAASGLPGATSLAKLGQGRYTLTRVIGPGTRTKRDGYVINTRTQAMLTAAEHLLGFHLVLSQGSYNPGGDPSSAGTHDGGGVVDVSVSGMSAATRNAVARALRQVGFAAWVRNPSQGNWPWHIHAAAINDTDLSSQAQNQIGDYYLGFNGLANHGPDDGPRIPIQTWEEYQRTHATARDTGSVAPRNDYDGNPRGFAQRNCTAFAAYRVASRTGRHNFSNSYGGTTWGDAGHWVVAARHVGIRVDRTPTVGAIAVNVVHKVGHVAYVNAVYSDGSFDVEEYNWNHRLAYGTRSHVHLSNAQADFQWMLHF